MVGRSKFAPGTLASLAACFLFFVLLSYISFFYLFLVTLSIFLYSFIAINNSFEEFNGEDPQEIVVDEVAGQMLTLLAIPIYETLYPLPWLYYFIPAFLLFRLFDIWKPYPISYIDNNIKGALGIMLDDIFASVYSIIILIIIFFFLGG